MVRRILDTATEFALDSAGYGEEYKNVVVVNDDGSLAAEPEVFVTIAKVASKSKEKPSFQIVKLPVSQAIAYHGAELGGEAFASIEGWIEEHPKTVASIGLAIALAAHGKHVYKIVETIDAERARVDSAAAENDNTDSHDE